MGGRMKNKSEKRNRELIHELLDLTLDINGMGEPEEGLTDNHPTAFLDFFGHVGAIQIRVFTEGWRLGATDDIKVESHSNIITELEDAVRKLKAIKAETPGAATPRESR